MTRLGFVGVGKHAQKLAAAFRECGAEIVAYDRAKRTEAMIRGTDDKLDGFGSWMGWGSQLLAPGIGALIICAPPEVTTEVALACAKAGKRCVATKPLIVSDEPPFGNSGYGPESFRDRNLYVDLWRLYSPAWKAMKAELRGKKIEQAHVDFYGNGPMRHFSGLLDYGPHALAFVADLLGEIPQMTWKVEADTYKGFRAQAIGMTDIMDSSQPVVRIETGNSSNESRAIVRVKTERAPTHVWVETTAGTHAYEVDDGGLRGERNLMEHDRALALRNFCRAFLAGEPSNTLALSCQAMRVLMPIVS